MAWLEQHANVVNAFLGFGTFLLWAVYAYLFYSSYERQHRPRIVIDRLAGPGTEGNCAITNLSHEFMYLECVFVVARSGDETFTTEITEHIRLESTSQRNKRELVSLVKQGPVDSGELVILGTLHELARKAVTAESGREAQLETLSSLEIRVVGTVSGQDRLIGARKRFGIDLVDDRTDWQPARRGTQQMLSRRELREVRSWLDGAGAC